jgi:tRNA threonylcarbamoyladenosine biosynthesis protein TsaE
MLKSLQSIQSHAPDDTRSLGARLANLIAQMQLSQPLIIELNGELGAGKTTFVGGFLRALGVVGAVRSPTYTLIEPYDLSNAVGGTSVLRVYHLDLYRLSNATELEMLALRDLLEPGAVLLVEWAERGRGALPDADLVIQLAYPNAEDAGAQTVSERIIQISPTSRAGTVLATALQATSDEAGVSS